MLFISAKLRAPLLLGSSFYFCAAVIAQGPRERPRYVLQTLDLDHDGKLSAQEIQSAPTSLLGIDRNGDGQITSDEMEPPRIDVGLSPDDLVKQLISFDRNGDGVLTPEELPERMRSMFARADANHDGKLTPEEIRQTVAHTGTPNGPAVRPGAAGGMMRMDPVLNALDLDHDGIISAEEIKAASGNLLVLDANHDGAIAPEEMRVRQQTPAERAAHVLDEHDTNRDGKLSPEEVPDGLRARFADADSNKDGFLDAQELAQMFASTPQNGGPANSGRNPAQDTQSKGQPK